MTSVTVHLSGADLVDDLVDALRLGGCLAWRTGLRTCRVEHVAALDEQEARVEVAFFLRAWGARLDGAQASLVG
jgi:hypothetical protein